MTEATKNSMVAINKWFYYAMNYRLVEMEVDYFGEKGTRYLPDCFAAFPVCIRNHFYEKWDYLYDKYGCRAVLMAFYGELSSKYQKDLMAWILDNYNDEQKLKFEEDE